MFITQRYTLHHAILYSGEFSWARELLEKWENQSKWQLCKEKSWIQGLAPKYSD